MSRRMRRNRPRRKQRSALPFCRSVAARVSQVAPGLFPLGSQILHGILDPGNVLHEFLPRAGKRGRNLRNRRQAHDGHAYRDDHACHGHHGIRRCPRKSGSDQPFGNRQQAHGHSRRQEQRAAAEDGDRPRDMFAEFAGIALKSCPATRPVSRRPGPRGRRSGEWFPLRVFREIRPDHLRFIHIPRNIPNTAAAISAIPGCKRYFSLGPPQLSVDRLPVRLELSVDGLSSLKICMVSPRTESVSA